MADARYIVELEPGVWLAEGEGDPPRTLVRDNARVFISAVNAWRALTEARSDGRRFERAEVLHG